MQANTEQTELTLNATLDETPSESELTVEASFVPDLPRTRKQKKQYRDKIYLLGTIHAEIADAINKRRKLEHEAWFIPYVIESKDNLEYVRLHHFGMSLADSKA